MMATPENSVGLSAQRDRTNNIIYGSPISNRCKVARGEDYSG